MAKGWADEKLQIALVSWVFINILTAIDDLILGYVFTNDYTKSFVSVSNFMVLVNVLFSQSLNIVLLQQVTRFDNLQHKTCCSDIQNLKVITTFGLRI